MIGQARNKIAGFTYLPQTRADEQTGIQYPVYSNPSPKQQAQRAAFSYLANLWVICRPFQAVLANIQGTPTTQAADFINRNSQLFDINSDGSSNFYPESLQIAPGKWNIDIVIDGIADYPVQLQLEGGVLNPQPEKQYWPLYIFLIEMDATPRVLGNYITVYSDPNFSMPIPSQFNPDISYIYFLSFNPAKSEFSRTEGYLIQDLIY